MQGPHLVRYSTHSLTRTTPHVLALANTQTNEHSHALSRRRTAVAQATKQRSNERATKPLRPSTALLRSSRALEAKNGNVQRNVSRRLVIA